MLGPYEDRIVLAQGRSPVNGPHQGGWVRTPGGEDWFLHFQDRGPYGRIVHLQPMRWADGWPVIGDDPDGDGTGEPVHIRGKPRVAGTVARAEPQTGDEFAGRALGLQWQWNANPRPEWASVEGGTLRLFAAPLTGPNLWSAGHVLAQKFPAPTFTATARLAAHDAAPGDWFALTVFGLDYAYVGVRRTAAGGYELVQARVRDADRGSAEQPGAPVALPGGAVWLRVRVEEAARDSARCRFAYSTDGARFTPVGEPFFAREGKWVGAKVGLVAVAGGAPGGGGAPTAGARRGYAAVDWFRVE